MGAPAGLVTPIYAETARSGPDHAPDFEVEVRIGELEPGRGSGRSKREAEHDAATRGAPPRRRVGGPVSEEQDPVMADAPTDTASRRAGFVALIGAPNAGKSTLLNALVGSKVSIVTHKVQTTRALVRGIAIHGDAQIVFVDTPGIFAPRRRLERAMVTTAWGGAADADLVALLIDARKGLSDENRAILTQLAEYPDGRPRILILNKIDLVKRDTLLALAGEANDALPLRPDLHDLGADRRRDRRPHGLSSPRPCRPDRGSTRKTRCRTCRSAGSPPRSPAKS